MCPFTEARGGAVVLSKQMPTATPSLFLPSWSHLDLLTGGGMAWIGGEGLEETDSSGNGLKAWIQKGVGFEGDTMFWTTHTLALNPQEE